MSDIDFQNGFLCGMATKGLNKSVGALETGYTLYGHLIENGSRGVWPLILKDGAWKATQVVSSSIYSVINGTDEVAFTRYRSVLDMGASYGTAVI